MFSSFNSKWMSRSCKDPLWTGLPGCASTAPLQWFVCFFWAAPLAFLVLNWLVLSLLLWRNTLRLLLPPPPPFGYPNKNGGRSLTKTIVASRKNWKDPSNHCHYTPPTTPPFFFFFTISPSQQILPPIQFQCEKRVVMELSFWTKSSCVNLCGSCVGAGTAHRKSINLPVEFFFSLNKTYLSA